MLGKRKLEKLRKTVRLHLNWFVAAVLGQDMLTADERKELSKFKKLPGQDLSLADKSYLLGRLKAILKKSEYKDLDWESLVEEKPSLSSLEKLALEEARVRAAKYVTGLADDIAKGIFDELQKAQNAAVSEATIKDIISDEVALGVIERKHYKEVASSLAERTKSSMGKRWEVIAHTELHRAKTSGTAQAIANKVDIYSKSDGVNSLVSIVPDPGTCPDCAKHYLDKSGNPKVFKLSQLMGAGTNADSSHEKKNGVHVKWKTVLPPMHPSCRCELKFIPPGYSWVDGKLRLTDKSKLTKALPGQSNSPTVATAVGGKSPAKATVGTAPKLDMNSGQEEQMSPCPFGGGDACKKHGGNGAKQHKAGGSIMRAHQQALRSGAKAEDPEAARQLRAQTIQQAKEYGEKEHPHAEQLAHIEKGGIVDEEPLGEEEKGAFESYRVTIDGNGRALVKPMTKKVVAFSGTGAILCGETTTIPGTQHKREKSAYNLHMAFGLTDHVPPTSTRTHNGKQSSIQSWKEGYRPLATLSPVEDKETRASDDPVTLQEAGKPPSRVKALLDKAPEDKREALKEKISEGTVMQLVMNSGDAHSGNILINDDFSDVQFIDNGAAFGHSMYGTSSVLHRDMHRAGMKLTIPEKLNDKMSKMTLFDIKRAAPDISDTEHAQTFLRMRYVQHLQETEGHLDYKKFRPMLIKSTHGGMLTPRPGFWGDDSKAVSEMARAALSEKDPVSLFEKFAKNYIKEVEADESHPDHESIKEMTKGNANELFMGYQEFLTEKVKPHAEVPASSDNQGATVAGSSKSPTVATAAAPRRRRTATADTEVAKSLWIDLSKSWPNV